MIQFSILDYEPSVQGYIIISSKKNILMIINNLKKENKLPLSIQEDTDVELTLVNTKDAINLKFPSYLFANQVNQYYIFIKGKYDYSIQFNFQIVAFERSSFDNIYIKELNFKLFGKQYKFPLNYLQFDKSLFTFLNINMKITN